MFRSISSQRTRASLSAVALLGSLLSIASVPAAAAPPTDCGAIGSAGVVPMVFGNPTGTTVEATTTTVGATATYADVATVDGQSIDARATLSAISGGNIEFENSVSDDARFLLSRTGTTMSATVTWDFYVSGDLGSPVPVLSSWVIGDIDGSSRESLAIPTAGLTSMQALTTDGVLTDATADPATATGNLVFDSWSTTPPEGSWVQLDFAGVSQMVITYNLGTGGTGARYTHTGNGDLVFAGATDCTGVSDHDGDGTVDIDDTDDDNDGIPDAVEGDGDGDVDGIPNYKDLDSDNDGITDATEDAGSAGLADFDADGTPNYLDLDADGDGNLDADEAGHGLTHTAGVLPGPYGANGMHDAAETADDTDSTAVTEAYVLQNNDGGTVDFLESADVEMVSVTSPSVVPGDSTNLTLTVQNNGIGDAGDITVSYPLPTNTSLAVSPGCAMNGANIECVIGGPVSDGASPTVVINLDTDPSAVAGVENLAATIDDTNTPDANGTNNSAAGTFTFLNPIADLEITSVSSPSTTPGTTATVDIDFVNNGPSDAQNFEVSYPVPSSSTFVPGTSTAGCVLDSGGLNVVCDVSGAIAPSGTGSVSIDFAVSASASAGTQSTSATAQNQTTSDNVAANDSLASSFTVGGPVADIEVSATTPTITPGESGTVTLNVSYDGGPSVATDTEIVYVLPGDVSVDGPLPAGCTEGPVGTVTCDGGDIASGSVSFDVDVAVDPSAAGAATLDGTVTGSTSATDADGGSGEADVNTTAAEADLVVTVTDPAAALPPGTTGVVNLDVANSGPSDAAGVSIVYVLPSSILVDTATGLPSGCAESPVGTVTCTPVATLTTGGSVDFDIPILMPSSASSTGTFDDGTVTATTTATDAVAVNNTNINSTIFSGSTSADLEISLVAAPDLAPGTSGVVDLQITNNGPSDGGSVEVTYSLPPGVDFDFAATNPNGCVLGGNVVTCVLAGPILDGATIPVVIPVVMSATPPPTGPAATSVELQNQSVLDVVDTNDGTLVAIGLDLTGDSDGDGIPDSDEIDPLGTGTTADTDGDGTPDYLDNDSDNDGILDADETNGGDATVDTDGDDIPDYLDLDSDNDGIPDVTEAGNGDLDTDDDGTIDAMDDPATGDADDDGVADAADTGSVNTDGSGPDDYRDLDSDNDGVNDVVEGGDGDLDANGDGVIDVMIDPTKGDADGDGIADAVDPSVPDTDGVGGPDYQDLDADGDGIADVVESGNGDLDTDDDGVIDAAAVVDADGDGAFDGVPAGPDTDGDGAPDSMDADSDNDGIPDSVEGTIDTDGDGIPDYQDLDSDNDGILDNDEAGPNPTNPVDTDRDGTPDYQELDSDNDGILDVVEGGNGNLDSNGDGTIDAMDDPASGDTDGNGLADGADILAPDADNDGTPDSQELDSDGDGVSDIVEVGNPSNPVDTDGDGTPDYQDLDSDDDGKPDADEPSGDSDGDGITDRVDFSETVLAGVVRDERTGKPLGNATVVITDSAGHVYSVVTDADGSYTFTSTAASPLSSGPVSVSATANGYTQELGTVQVIAGETSNRDLSLGQTSTPGQLAFTGSSTGLMVMASLVMLVGGVVLVVGSRRRLLVEAKSKTE